MMSNWQCWFLDGTPPSPWMQQINDSLHIEPYSLIVHGIYWVTVLVCAPFAAVIMMFWTLIRLFLHLVGYSTRTVDTSAQELAVVIMGCDSGFGLTLAMACHAKGYHVFCGCLKEDSLQMFSQKERMTPLVVDVCKDQDVAAMSKAVSDWIDADGDGGKKRFLHAVVNNAGIGDGGLVDWIGMDV